MSDYLDLQTKRELLKSYASQVKEKKKEYAEELPKARERDKEKKKKDKFVKGLFKKIDKVYKSRLPSRSIVREDEQSTVDVSQPVYSQDKSRFFKKTWEEQKRQLYFKWKLIFILGRGEKNNGWYE